MFHLKEVTHGPADSRRRTPRGLMDLSHRWNAPVKRYDWASQHFEVERKFGIEKHSIEADPMFVDVQNGMLSLRPESPAFALGIEPISLQSVGLLPDHPFKTTGQ